MFGGLLQLSVYKTNAMVWKVILNFNRFFRDWQEAQVQLSYVIRSIVKYI